MIRRTIVTRDKDTILRLYKSLVRPQLEYCIQVWSLYLKQDMEKLEKVQRRATKMIWGYKDLGYEERLKRCGLGNVIPGSRIPGSRNLFQSRDPGIGKHGIPYFRDYKNRIF